LTLWAFALAAWERPGVSEACIHLQDRHGQCVPLLLWRAWADAEGRPVPDGLRAEAVALARVRERAIIAPLRAARRAVAAEPDRLEAAQKAEIEAERALLSALENLTPDSFQRAGEDLAAALESLAEAWNGCRARSAVKVLVARLA
jgi:uncharacterized protein (TIGR02444 family)